ncbi:hypothetical protein NBRC116188_22590 [Oceaniserpentilla sp. 4NH20-0058]|uniref:hypothetical protein n=1 Tax=Oceaniserpentilla sp. 4NH20-0058 TaxID=3127660 RepID=UPI0031080798
MYRPLKLFLLACISIALVGCATYGQDVRQGLELTKQGQYTQAAEVFEKSLNPKGDDRLLYYTELGMVYHLAGDYKKSNQLLETAERISEDLYTQRVSDMLTTAMSNPRQGPYRAANFERVFINYYKALNYLMIAHGHDDAKAKDRALEGARVESRRIDMILSDIETQKGNYQEQADKEKSMFSKLMRIFDKLTGEIIDRNKIVYRNDAFGHYLAGMIYEQHREYDDARVAYQKSASLYENGYQEQYGLKKEITEQGWFDTIRMMQKAGGWGNEWPKLSRTKLSKDKRQQLKDFESMGHLVVLEHTGMVPERDEMNMYLTADPNTRQVVMHPILTGDPRRQLDQRFWFYALYADKGITDLMSAIYENRVIPALMQYSMVKREYLGPLWGVADKLGLVEVMKSGMRITVPYYRVTSYQGAGESSINVSGNDYPLVVGQSVAHMAVQQQLLDASSDIQEAMARAAFKNLTAHQAASLGGDAGAVLGFLGKIAANASSAAETRNWLLLPDQIKVTRIPLAPGTHTVTLTSEPVKGQKKTTTQQVEVKAGEMSVWKVRTFPAQNTQNFKQLGI